MSSLRTIEVTATSPSSYADAIRNGLRTVGSNFRNVRNAWVANQRMATREDAVDEFEVMLRVTFLLDPRR